MIFSTKSLVGSSTTRAFFCLSSLCFRNQPGFFQGWIPPPSRCKPKKDFRINSRPPEYISAPSFFFRVGKRLPVVSVRRLSISRHLKVPFMSEERARRASFSTFEPIIHLTLGADPFEEKNTWKIERRSKAQV